VGAFLVNQDRAMPSLYDLTLLGLLRPFAVAFEAALLVGHQAHNFVVVALTYWKDFFRVDIRFKVVYAHFDIPLIPLQRDEVKAQEFAAPGLFAFWLTSELVLIGGGQPSVVGSRRD
jgi:hypothetical protein